MNLLFLRGQVPTDRDPNQIVFDTLQSCDDMWTHYAYELAHRLSIDNTFNTHIVYWGDTRTNKLAPQLTETWTPSLDNFTPDFQPDLIFCRGGFKEYDALLNRYPSTFKIYYGAGQRFHPQSDTIDYDLILVDTLKQFALTKYIFPHTQVAMLVKPACENIFYPRTQEKIYDAIFVANQSARDIKGHHFVINHFPKHLKLLVVGICNTYSSVKYPHITFTGWIPRKEIPKYYAQSKFSIIASDVIDSCPRVIAESLACNCPILCLDTVNVEKWNINSDTGMFTNRIKFRQDIKYMIDNYSEFKPRVFYMQNTSQYHSIRYLIKHLQNNSRYSTDSNN